MNPAASKFQEIERRFLIEGDLGGFSDVAAVAVDQGYIAIDPAVRIRRIDDRQFFLTVKRGSQVTREEREVELTRDQFSILWPLTEGRRVSKARRRIPWKDHLIELDVFSGRHEGLRIAEVEFGDEDTMRAFEPPAWFGREITGEARYANVNLATS